MQRYNILERNARVLLKKFTPAFLIVLINKGLLSSLNEGGGVFSTIPAGVITEHDVGRGATGIQFGFHEVHVGGDVGKKLAVATAQVVQAWLAVAVGQQAVLRTFAVTGKKPLALMALAGQVCLLGQPELVLPLAVKHFRERLLTDVA